MVSYCLRLLFFYYEIVVEGHKTFSIRVKHLNFDGKERKLLVLSGKGQKNAFSSALASLWLRRLHLRDLSPLNLFAGVKSKEPFSLFFLPFYAWLRARSYRFRVQVVSRLWVVFLEDYQETNLLNMFQACC